MSNLFDLDCFKFFTLFPLNSTQVLFLPQNSTDFIKFETFIIENKNEIENKTVSEKEIYYNKTETEEKILKILVPEIDVVIEEIQVLPLHELNEQSEWVYKENSYLYNIFFSYT